MKILLLRPKAPAESINLQSFMICEPLELEYDAAMLKKLAVVDEVDLVDMLLEKKPVEYYLSRKKYDMVCMTSYITTVGVVKAYAEKIKALNHNILTVVGGVHAEVVPEDFSTPDIDCILWCNGVKTLEALTLLLAEFSASTEGFQTASLAETLKNAPLPEGVFESNKEKPKIENGNLPLPDRAITEKYRSHYNYIYHDKCATIKTSFGCPYRCSFCFCTRVCPYSARTLDSVMEELKSIREDNVFIVDDDFLVSRERLTAFCEALDKFDIHKHYIAFGRADFISQNEDIILMLRDHGFEAFFVGIESFKTEDLKDFSKQSDVEMNIAAVGVLERNGLQCYSGLIVGEDWVKKDFDTLIAHLNSFEHPLVNIQPITPMPGTPLFESYSYPIEVSREDYALWDMAHVVFKPQKMPKRLYYYHIVRAYLKTSANKKQRKFIREKYGMRVYRRVKHGATAIFFQYVRLMIKG